MELIRSSRDQRDGDAEKRSSQLSEVDLSPGANTSWCQALLSSVKSGETSTRDAVRCLSHRLTILHDCLQSTQPHTPVELHEVASNTKDIEPAGTEGEGRPTSSSIQQQDRRRAEAEIAQADSAATSPNAWSCCFPCPGSPWFRTTGSTVQPASITVEPAGAAERHRDDERLRALHAGGDEQHIPVPQGECPEPEALHLASTGLAETPSDAHMHREPETVSVCEESLQVTASNAKDDTEQRCRILAAQKALEECSIVLCSIQGAARVDAHASSSQDSGSAKELESTSFELERRPGPEDLREYWKTGGPEWVGP